MAEETKKPEKVKIIVENNQDGNRQFPGFKRKYPKLFDIPGGAAGEKAVVIEVDAEDFDEIKTVMWQENVYVQDFEKLEAERRSFFGRMFSKFFGYKEEESVEEKSEPELDVKDLRKEWIQLYKKLDTLQKGNFSDFDPREANAEELKKQIEKAEKLVNAK